MNIDSLASHASPEQPHGRRALRRQQVCDIVHRRIEHRERDAGIPRPVQMRVQLPILA
jgi:hypothetical protein